jgi:hypothetical protein
VGKSAFAVFLSRLFCSADKQGQNARRQLEDVDPRLSNKLNKLGLFDNRSKGFFPILATARRISASKCLAESILASVSSVKDIEVSASVQKLSEMMKTQQNGNPLDSRQIVNAINSLSEAAIASGYEGVFIIIDELGKLFEYAARYPQRSDLFVLQEIAEQAARSNSNRIFFIGLLHQSFQEYGIHLDMGTRREWAKIQGRFEDIAFMEPAEQVVRLIAQSIRRTSGIESKLPSNYLNDLATAALKAGVAPPTIQDSEFEATAKAAYPLHPLTLVALPFIFRRFAQNERSLFSYLSSLEPFGFQEFIKTHELTFQNPPMIRLGDLFDFFTKNFGAGLYRHPHAIRWLEAVDVLERKEGLSTLHREIVKTIGILNALGEFCHLRATEEIISVAITDSAAPDCEIREALNSLKEASIITYRNFNHTYRIWEGSDVDIEQRIAEGERKIRHGLSLAESLKRYLRTRPLVARRHSFETGSLRYFSVEYIDAPENFEAHLKVPIENLKGHSSVADADGKILVLLSESPVIAEKFKGLAIEHRVYEDTLFAIPQLIGELRSIVIELGALRWVWENTPELRDDRVARREVSLRIAEAERMLQRNVEGLLDPREEPVGSGCLWIYAGELIPVRSPVDVSHWLSKICDKTYDKTPRILNELITRRSLSSAAAAARRNLIEQMLSHQSEESLGIQGYPPERSMYESVLRATGLHRQDGEGNWGFNIPGHASSTKIVSAWNCLRDEVFGRQPEPIALDRLFARLAAPPFGVLPGLHPVLLCAFMMAYPDETTLYREGTFLPQPGIADFEVLMRRPELFAVAGSRIAGDRALVVQRLAKGLKVRATTVSVVRALFGMVKGLPEFAWNTRCLPDITQALRETFRSAKSPEQFLFVMLPEALGLPAFSNQKPNQSDLDRFFDVLNENLRLWADATPRTISSACDALLKACGLKTDEAAWTDLRHMAVTLEPSVTESALLTFIQRVAHSGSDAEGIESVLALVATRPPQNWHDTDVERFPAAAATIGRAFLGAVRTARLGDAAGRQLPKLTPRERKQADALADQVRRYIQRTAKDASPQAIRAAMMRLIQEMES